MPVIDIDSHFEPTDDWLDEFPALKAELPERYPTDDPRFTIAAYVGKHGWVDMKLGKKPNWQEVEQFITESYRMIAPKKLVKQLDGEPAPKAKKKVAKQQKKKKKR